MILQYALYTAPGGTLLADYSTRAQGLTFATNDRGYAECSAFIPMALVEMLQLYDTPGLPHVVVRDEASGRAFEGRLEDVKIATEGLTLTAFGYARALGDVPYTALWSVTRYDGWEQGVSATGAIDQADQFTMDLNNRIFITINEGATIVNSGAGGYLFRIPDASSRTIAGIAFDIRYVLPTGIGAYVQTRDSAGGFLANDVALSGPLNNQQTLFIATDSDTAMLAVMLYNASGGSVSPTGITGTNFIRLTNVRIVSSLGNQISTTTTAGVSAGSSVSLPVGSSAGVYVGQQLRVNAGAGAGAGETVTVTSVPDATHIVVASLAATYGSSGITIKGHRIFADQIAADVLANTRTVNADQLSSDTSQIQSPGVDLLDETYLDQYPADILDSLTVRGDTASRIWEWGVLDDRALCFRPQYATARAWYTDTTTIDIDRTLDSLTNSVYAVYQDASGAEVRSDPSTDTASVARYAITRRQALSVQASSSVQAGYQVAAALADSATIQPRSGMVLRAVYDALGNRFALTEVRAGDTITVRNLPPNLSATVDRVRTFRVSRAEYHADDDTLSVEPGAPLPLLEVLLARLAKGQTT